MSYFIAFCSKNSLFVTKYTLATLAARVVFVPKKSIFDKICILITQNSYQVSQHSQGGMKFATQISPLLNLFIKSRMLEF
jgi:hypothetical protein